MIKMIRRKANVGGTMKDELVLLTLPDENDNPEVCGTPLALAHCDTHSREPPPSQPDYTAHIVH